MEKELDPQNIPKGLRFRRKYCIIELDNLRDVPCVVLNFRIQGQLGPIGPKSIFSNGNLYFCRRLKFKLFDSEYAKTEFEYAEKVFWIFTPRQYDKCSVYLDEKERFVLGTSTGPDRKKISNLFNIIIIIIFIWNLSRPNCHRHRIYIIIGFCEKRDIDYNRTNLNSRKTWDLNPKRM